MNAKRKLEAIAANAERAAALPERERILALLVLNEHLSREGRRWKIKK